MARRARIIGQAVDVHGREWDVREERPTEHGWPVRLGWPADAPRGQGCGGPRAIATPELAAYLESLRLDPDAIRLPICRTAIKRLRRGLGHDWRADNAAWWRERCLDATSTIEDFRAAHGKSTGAVSKHRPRRGHARLYDQDGCLLLTRAEACRVLHMSSQTVDYGIRLGELKTIAAPSGSPKRLVRLDDLFAWRATIKRRFRPDATRIPDDIEDWVRIREASKRTGRPEGVIFYRIYSGKLLSIMLDRHRLVHPDDVMAIPYQPRPHASGEASISRQRGGWTPEQEALLGTDTDKAVAALLGRTPQSVTSHRRQLGIPGVRRGAPRKG